MSNAALRSYEPKLFCLTGKVGGQILTIIVVVVPFFLLFCRKTPPAREDALQQAQPFASAVVARPHARQDALERVERDARGAR